LAEATSPRPGSKRIIAGCTNSLGIAFRSCPDLEVR
jgi:hypothetical protein